MIKELYGVKSFITEREGEGWLERVMIAVAA